MYAEIAMGQYAVGSERFYSALSILKNKITGMANDALTHNGTVFNFDAIMARLDFVFSDKRPIHIIEQELSVLRQGSFHFKNIIGGACSVPQLGGGKTRRSSVYTNFVRK